MLRSFVRVLLTACSAIALANLFVMPACTAEPPSKSGAASAPRKKNTDNPEFKTERLTKPIEVADMPLYSGKSVVFVVGTAFPYVKGGSSVTMQFSTKDQPKKVLDWYKETLKQYGWQPMQNMTGANGVAGMKSHNICQVMTLPPSTKGAKCDFLLRFKLYRAQ